MTPEEEVKLLTDELVEVKLVLIRLKKDRDKWRESSDNLTKLVSRLRLQINEFRTVCDPYELKVMVTSDELASGGVSNT
jgi:uncharacterized coiled-coil DUF342 family protein